MPDNRRTPSDRPGDRPRLTGLLARLARLNPTTVVFAALLLMLGVLLVPGPVGAGLALVVAGALGWLLTRTWPVLAGHERALRLLGISLLVVIAVYKLLG